MNVRMWRRSLVAAVVVATVAVGSPAAADEGQLLTGDDPAHAAAQPGDVAAAGTIVPMPDLGITHRLPAGGMNLWRMPLSELETGYGQPQLVKTLNFGGFSYDNSKTLAGDVGDITASDDGTADHIIWHAQPNGGVLLWAVGGGSDTTPRLWQDLRTGGWSYADSHPMLGDVNGDGWDDLVVLHSINPVSANAWVFLSDGHQLGAPQVWSYSVPAWAWWNRYVLADVNRDGAADLVQVRPDYGAGPGMSWVVRRSMGGSSFDSGAMLFTGPVSGGWSFYDSRQLVGDVTGDGVTDMVTIHAQPNGGILVWLHKGCQTWPGTPCLSPPVIWQDLRTGGWSFAGSRQYLADTNGDGIDDLVSVHQQAFNAGELIWRHVSTGTGLLAPQVIADLRTGGWRYLVSREGVADTWGLRG